MSTLTAKIKSTATIEAVIIRKDGTREDLGIICSSKKENIFTKLKRMVK